MATVRNGRDGGGAVGRVSPGPGMSSCIAHYPDLIFTSHAGSGSEHARCTSFCLPSGKCPRAPPSGRRAPWL